MKCPLCVEAGDKSTVTPQGGSRTLMGWTQGHFDEEGEWVAHRDPNTITTHYTCSQGHYFSIASLDGEEDRVVEKGTMKKMDPETVTRRPWIGP